MTMTLKQEHVCHGGVAARKPAVLGVNIGENEKDTRAGGRPGLAGAR